MATATPVPSIGEVRRDAAYTLDAIEKFGFGKAAIRTARRNGLKVRRVGRRAIILGSDLLDYIESRGT